MAQRITIDYLIRILKVLLKIDNIEILKLTIESIIEELEEKKTNNGYQDI